MPIYIPYATPTAGDQEDMDLEEYNFAYALWLEQEG
jgi:hypothetical protein